MMIIADSDTPGVPLPDVPLLVLTMLLSCMQPILAWVSQLVYQSMRLHCADHPLVQLNRWYDPQRVVDACRGFHHADGQPGRPPTYTIAQLVRMELVRTLYDTCSDPALEELLATNLLVRWYVGLSLTDPTPDHSTLAAFHAWMTIHAPDALFRDGLRFLQTVDPEAATTPQIVDTFAMASPAAPCRTVAHLLHHLGQRLLRTWDALAPAAAAAALTDHDRVGWATPLVIARTREARQQRLQQVVARTQRLVRALTAQLSALEAPVQTTLQVYLDALAKVQADELTTDADGRVQERTSYAHGARRLASAVDREATFRKHGSDPAVFGANAVISTTATRITACIALTGCTPDSDAPEAVLRQLQDADQALPEALIMDQAGGWGKTRATVAAISDGQTRMVAQIPTSGGSDPNRFSVAQFQVDPDRTRCTCPQGVVSTRAYAHGDSDGITFRFLASQCRGCPLWSQCRDPQAKPGSHRTVFISDYHIYLRQAQQHNQSPEGRLLLRSRWRVEPTIAWLVRYQGSRQARRVGLVAAQCQLFQACAVRNLLLWLGRVARGSAPRPGTVP